MTFSAGVKWCMILLTIWEQREYTRVLGKGWSIRRAVYMESPIYMSAAARCFPREPAQIPHSRFLRFVSVWRIRLSKSWHRDITVRVLRFLYARTICQHASFRVRLQFPNGHEPPRR